MSSSSELIELNIGGSDYTTTLSTLTSQKTSRLAELFDNPDKIPRDSRGRYFLDRDGPLFRFILDFLRHDSFLLPENFPEKARLRSEADYYRLDGLVETLDKISPKSYTKQSAASVITLGYRGTFAFGRDGLADVKFRKLSRILIAGRGALCREVFGETLNDSRDPDRGTTDRDRYSSRYFLKHCVLEQAFDMLYGAGFELIGSCGCGTNSSGMEIKPGQDSEENKWQHYNEFIFLRRV